MNDVHLGLKKKRVVDFLLVIIELFSLDVTAEALQMKIDRNRRFRSKADFSEIQLCCRLHCTFYFYLYVRVW